MCAAAPWPGWWLACQNGAFLMSLMSYLATLFHGDLGREVDWEGKNNLHNTPHSLNCIPHLSPPHTRMYTFFNLCIFPHCILIEVFYVRISWLVWLDCYLDDERGKLFENDKMETDDVNWKMAKYMFYGERKPRPFGELPIRSSAVTVNF